MAKNQKKSQYRKDLDVYRAALKEDLKPLIRKANMMLTNLETLSKQPGFEGVDDFAYRVAMKEIRDLRGEEFRRFNIPKNIHSMEKAKRAVEQFLQSTTSTKAGIVGVYEKNAAFLNEQFGSSMNWKDMGSFLRAAGFESLKKEYDSETAIIMMKALLENKDLSKEEFKEQLQNHQIKSEWNGKGLDEVDSETLSDFVDSDISWDELFPIE